MNVIGNNDLNTVQLVVKILFNYIQLEKNYNGKVNILSKYI